MSLSKADILHLAKLARLELSEAEVDNFTIQLDEVLHYLDKLAELKNLSVSVFTAPTVLCPRADKMADYPGGSDIIKLAPRRAGNLLEVPPIFSATESPLAVRRRAEAAGYSEKVPPEVQRESILTPDDK